MTKKNIYLWACDYSEVSGEGNLAKLFVKDLRNSHNNKIKVVISKRKIYKYFLPFIGILFCWKYYLRKQSVGYINYLPLWNFFIFILLPPKTILGPITGGANYSNANYPNFIIRKFFFPIFYKISEIFLLIRSPNIIFSTELLKKHLFKKTLKNSKFNFVIKSVKFKKKFKKKIDFIIYYRKHKNKETFFPYKLVQNLILAKKKISIIGDTLNLKGVKNCGTLNNIKTQELQSKARFTIASTENIYSLFILECISNNVKVLVDKKYRKQITFYKKNFKFIEFNKTNRFHTFN